MTLVVFSVAEFYAQLDIVPAALVAAVTVLLAVFMRIGYHILVERLSTGFQSLRPRQCSIYDPYFWYHERYWKMSASLQLAVLDGTPLKGVALRLHGMRIGARLFDDGCGMTERTMIAIGDDCTLNAGSIIQPHSQEDGAFKSDRIELGAGCTLGIGAWAHYGSKMGDGSALAPNAFLMKGEEVPLAPFGPGTRRGRGRSRATPCTAAASTRPRSPPISCHGGTRACRLPPFRLPMTSCLAAHAKVSLR